MPGYRRLPVYKAAQAVQRSADGSAYIQYEQTAASLARGFTGHDPRSVWCWYPKAVRQRARLTAASQELARAFGPLQVSTEGDPELILGVPRPADGWSMAAWLVSHARATGSATCGTAATSGGRPAAPRAGPARRPRYRRAAVEIG